MLNMSLKLNVSLSVKWSLKLNVSLSVKLSLKLNVSLSVKIYFRHNHCPQSWTHLAKKRARTISAVVVHEHNCYSLRPAPCLVYFFIINKLL